MKDQSFKFSHAITRKPGQSVTLGLRSVYRGIPDFNTMSMHHASYVLALKTAGVLVLELDPLEDYPDSLFVEDTALCLPEGVILMRPGAESRLGEVDQIAPHLNAFYKDIFSVKGEARIEAGDILATETEILVGRSERTNKFGILELSRLTKDWGYQVREVNTPPDILHFKTDCSLLDGNTILSTPKLARTGCFNGYNLIYTADGEDEAANTIRVNDYVIMPNGFNKTAGRLKDGGYNVIQVENSECAKIDGGMSCLSLRFTPNE
ncbi:MAG: dimethylargininase [Paracoccaceae bacterium]|jgi:dimethylargininase